LHVKHDEPNCVICGAKTKYISFTKGYSTTCSGSCATKLSWSGASERKEAMSKFVVANGYNKLCVGKSYRLGKKNKNPYPMSDAVLVKLEKLHAIPHTWNANPNKVDKQKESWSAKSNDELARIYNQQVETKIKNKTMHKYLQGKFTPNHPEKYAGDVTKIFYRSSWEKKFLLWCDTNPNILEYSSEELVIPYFSPVDNKMHRYFVDAAIVVKTQNNEIRKFLVEIKPSIQTKEPKKPKRITKTYVESVKTWLVNQAKWEAATKWCKDNNSEFKILTEHEINPK
jgi:hypothetical protein